MGIVIEFFGIAPHQTELLENVSSDADIRSWGKVVGNISINSLAVSFAFKQLQSTLLADLAGDASEGCRIVVVERPALSLLEQQLAALVAANADGLTRDLGQAVVDAIAEVQWRGCNLAVISS